MTEHFRTILEDECKISTCRALVPYRPVEPYDISEVVPADAAFLATLIANAGQSETARRKRRAAPSLAIERYRAGRALTDAPALFSIRSL